VAYFRAIKFIEPPGIQFSGLKPFRILSMNGKEPSGPESASFLWTAVDVLADRRFRSLSGAGKALCPARPLIKALREALGMSTAQLAKRLGIKQPSLVALEQSQAKGTIELATLQRVAEALDCTLVYGSRAQPAAGNDRP
jgi:DNA-binding XRE family transcriptional regulator